MISNTGHKCIPINDLSTHCDMEENDKGKISRGNNVENKNNSYVDE